MELPVQKDRLATENEVNEIILKIKSASKIDDLPEIKDGIVFSRYHQTKIIKSWYDCPFIKSLFEIGVKMNETFVKNFVIRYVHKD